MTEQRPAHWGPGSWVRSRGQRAWREPWAGRRLWPALGLLAVHKATPATQALSSQPLPVTPPGAVPSPALRGAHLPRAPPPAPGPGRVSCESPFETRACLDPDPCTSTVTAPRSLGASPLRSENTALRRGLGDRGTRRLPGHVSLGRGSSGCGRGRSQLPWPLRTRPCPLPAPCPRGRATRALSVQRTPPEGAGPPPGRVAPPSPDCWAQGLQSEPGLRAPPGLLRLHEPRRGPAQGPATPAPPGGQTRTTGPNARPGPCRLRPNRTDPGPWPEPSTAALRKLSPNSTSSSPYLVSAPKPTDTLGLTLRSPEAQGIVEGSLEEGAVGRRTRREVPAWGALGPPGQLLPHAPGAVVPACCRGQPRLREALALSVSSRPSLTKSERNP